MSLRGVGGAASTSSGGSLSVPNTGIYGVKPKPGDYVLLSGVVGGSTPIMTSPGFANVVSPLAMTGSGNVLFCLGKIAGANEPSSYTVSYGGVNDFGSIHCHSYFNESGVAVNAVSASFLNAAMTYPGSASNVQANSLIATKPVDLIIIAGVGNNINNGQLITSEIFTPPPGFAQVYYETAGFGTQLSPVSMIASLFGYTGGAFAAQPCGYQYTATANSPATDFGSFVIAIANVAAPGSPGTVNNDPQRRVRRHKGGLTMGLNIAEWF